MKHTFARHPSGRPSEAGHALILALFVLILTLTASALIAFAVDLRLRAVREQNQDLQLTALCDAGLAMALAELDARASYTGTGSAIPFGNGKILIEVEQTAFRHVQVDVEAAYSHRRRAVRADVRLEPTVVAGWHAISPVPEEVPWWR